MAVGASGPAGGGSGLLCGNEANFWWRERGYGFRRCSGRGVLGLEAVGTEGSEGFEGPVVGAFHGVETAFRTIEVVLPQIGFASSFSRRPRCGAAGRNTRSGRFCPHPWPQAFASIPPTTYIRTRALSILVRPPILKAALFENGIGFVPSYSTLPSIRSRPESHRGTI